MFYIDLKKFSTNILFININNIVIIIDFHLKNIIINDITIYNKLKTIEFLIQLFDEYSKKFINQG